MTASTAGRRRYWPTGWVVLLAVLVLGPALGPGFVLSYDMVFTPQQILQPWMLGLDSGLPRAAPQDAIVSLLSGPVPGQLLQKIVLLAILIVAGLGALRILRSQPRLIQAGAATLMIWNPWVAERLVIGHWGLLLGYAAAPWILWCVIEIRRGHGHYLPQLILWCALGSIVPSASLFTLLLIVPVFFAAKVSIWIRFAAGASVVIFTATWWVPALLNPSASTADPVAAAVFGVHAQGWAPPFLVALTGGGIWNSEVVLPSRALPWIVILGLIILLLAIAGIPRLLPLLDQFSLVWLIALAIGGYLLAVLPVIAGVGPLLLSIEQHIPGAGLLRDGQKLLEPLVILTALAAPLGLRRLLNKVSGHMNASPAGLIVLIVLPIAMLPDLAWGAFGRLAPADYPAGWQTVRSQIADGPPGDAISLPWTAFRQFTWNHDRTVLDPAPRYMTTTVLTNDQLTINRGNQRVDIAGDNPRSAQVGEVLTGSQPLAQALPPLGIRWVIESTDQPQPISADRLRGMQLVAAQDGLRLWRTPDDVIAPPGQAAAGVIMINITAALIVVISGVAWAIRGTKHRFRD